jgi:hypothetical protein
MSGADRSGAEQRRRSRFVARRFATLSEEREHVTLLLARGVCATVIKFSANLLPRLLCVRNERLRQRTNADFPLGVVVGRIHAGLLDEIPQGRFVLENVGTRARHAGDVTGDSQRHEIMAQDGIPYAAARADVAAGRHKA